jgi:hypothetical protein
MKKREENSKFEDFKKQMLKNGEISKEYDSLKPKYASIEKMIGCRTGEARGNPIAKSAIKSAIIF